jgi:hypothetical protein
MKKSGYPHLFKMNNDFFDFKNFKNNWKNNNVRATPTALLFLLWKPFRTFIVEKYAPTDVLFGFVK